MGRTWLLLGAQLGYMPGGWTLDPGDTQVCWGLAARPDSQSTEKATGHWATGMPLSFSGWRLAPPPPGYTHRSLVPPAQPLGSGAVLTSSMAHSVFPGGGEHPAPGRPQLQLWEPALFSSRCGCPHPVPARLSASGAGDFQGKMKKNHSIISWLGDRELIPALLTLLQGLPSLTPH